MNNERKTCHELTYQCAICGATYDSIQDRIHCETTCLKKQQEEEKRISEAKKKEEQEARKKEVENAIKHASQLLEAYTKDYGYYKHNVGDDVLWLSKIWHYFMM